MTETADFRPSQRHIRLDTILRLRWLAVLGQLAAIFIVAQGLEFEVEIVPCVSIIAVSAARSIWLCRPSPTRCSDWSRSRPPDCWR
ncbi:hypothetical protein ACVWYH_003897 [Bradyrhizobium sp. GM24.11]